MSPRRPPAEPPVIPGFTYIRPLGSGGFADVFLYEQHRPRRKVAVKVLLSGVLSEGARRQFDAEADTMAQLSTHPSIVTIYEAEIATDGRPYLAMEYCPLPNLGERYRKDPLSVADALRVGIQVAGAVETAHRAGILHRDIKPANILVTAYNNPALTDFGIAGTIEGGGRDQAEGMSIPWSPPESFGEGAESGVGTDVWALAATVYSLLAGRSPFELPGGANSTADLIDRIERVPLPRIGRVDVPDLLDRVLATAMAKSPGARYPSALAFARALQHVQAELGLAVTAIDVLDDVLGVEQREDDGEPGTRLRSVRSIDPSGPPEPSGPARSPGGPHPEATSSPTRARAGSTTGRPPEGTAAPSPPAPPDTVRRGAASSASVDEEWGAPPAPPVVDTTVHRPAREAAPVAVDAPEPPRRRWGWVALVVLLVVGGVGALALTRGGGGQTPSAAVTQDDVAVEPADPIGTLVPSPTDPVGTVVGDQVTFTWENPEPQEGDTYQYKVLDELGEGEAVSSTEPTATVPADSDGSTCVEVVIVRSGKLSTHPARACAP